MDEPVGNEESSAEEKEGSMSDDVYYFLLVMCFGLCLILGVTLI